MKKNSSLIIGLTFILVFVCIIISLKCKGQCYSRNGIMNEACESLTIFDPPAVGIDLGYNQLHILKLDVNYLTQDEIVYGISAGIKPYKDMYHSPEDGSINGFLGYNLIGCITLGVTFGYTHYTNYYQNNIDNSIIKSGYFKSNVGMSIKFITNYTSFPLTIGGYGSSAGLGVTIGTIIPLNNSLWHTIKNIF